MCVMVNLVLGAAAVSQWTGSSPGLYTRSMMMAFTHGLGDVLLILICRCRQVTSITIHAEHLPGGARCVTLNTSPPSGLQVPYLAVLNEPTTTCPVYMDSSGDMSVVLLRIRV